MESTNLEVDSTNMGDANSLGYLRSSAKDNFRENFIKQDDFTQQDQLGSVDMT